METTNSQERQISGFRVLSLPTRDGNLSEVSSSSIPPLVLSLPTRDGNPAPATAPHRSHRRFEPTYKGWKLRHLLLPLYLLPCFKPTYKGWKRSPAGPSPPSSSVLSLPTRDGNTTARMPEGLNAFVLSLPTRDGNTSFSHSYKLSRRVLSLPTRDGNQLPAGG